MLFWLTPIFCTDLEEIEKTSSNFSLLLQVNSERLKKICKGYAGSL